MASLTLSPNTVVKGSATTIYWSISGLSSAFTKENGYFHAGVTHNSFTQSKPYNKSDPIASIGGLAYPPSPSGSFSANAWAVRKASGSSMTIYGFIATGNTTSVDPHDYYPAGTATLYLKSPSFSRSVNNDAKTVTITVSGLASGFSVNIYIRPQTSGGTSKSETGINATGSSLSRTYTVVPGDYECYVYVDGMDLGSQYFTITANPTFSISTIDSTQKVTVTINDIASGYAIKIYIRLTSTSTLSVDDEFTASGSSVSRTYTLAPGTYVARVYVRGEDIGSDTFTLAARYSRPSHYTFSSEIAAGKPCTNLKYNAWNTFTLRIKETICYYNQQKLASLNENPTFTSATAGATITTTYFNQAIDALSKLTSPLGVSGLPSKPTKGSVISASLIHNLANTLNNCIDKIPS